ncbi:MAG: MaoC family dehydratase N-terminal domain-containing protein [Solirubrobacterales bacterium]|nr:MaoC family dehydratase N-terminal domain-containing protein [Solirubrobacterales bacterium]
MSTTTPQFNASAIGQWTEPLEFEVTRERLKAYAAATNDPIEPHANGDFASPVFAIVPAFQIGGEATLKVIPGELLMMVLHGEHDFHFHGPILPDSTVYTRSAPIGLHQRSSGVTVTVKSETTDSEGKLLVEQYLVSFVRGATAEESTGESAPSHAFDDSLRERQPDSESSQTFDQDQTFRYAEASGDPMPIHLDDKLAKSVGLPGIIIHGMCTMAFTSVALIEHACPDDPSRLRRLAVRFAKPTTPGQTITTQIWDAGTGNYAYETTADDGAVVIKDGLATVA